MNCSDFKVKAFDFLFELLSEENAVAFKAHAAGCASCNKELEKAQRQRSALGEWQPEASKLDLASIVMDKVSPRAEVLRARRMLVLKSALTIAACAVILLFAVSLFEPAVPDVDLRIMGSATIVPGEDSIYRVSAFDTVKRHMTEPGSIEVFISTSSGEIKIPASFEEGKGLVVRPLSSLEAGQAEIVFVHEAGRIVRQVNIKRPVDVFISTDHVCYKVGNTVRLKATVLDRLTGKPVAGAKVTFILREVEGIDARIVMKAEGTTDAFGVTEAEGVLSSAPVGGRVMAEAASRGEQVRKWLAVADVLPTRPAVPPGPSPNVLAIRIACLPDGGVFLQGRQTKYFIHTSDPDGRPVSCRISIGNKTAQTDEFGLATVEIKATGKLAVHAEDNKTGKVYAKTFRFDKMLSNIAIHADKPAVIATGRFSISILTTDLLAEVAMLDVFRAGRLIRAIEVPLSNGKGTVTLDTSDEESGTWRLVAHVGSGQDKRNTHSRNIYVQPSKRLIITTGKPKRLADGRLVIPVVVKDELGQEVESSIAARIEIPDGPCPDTHEVIRMNRRLLGREFSVGRKNFLGSSVTGLHSGTPGSDVAMAAGVRTPHFDLQASSRVEAMRAFKRRRNAVASWLSVVRYTMFPVLMVVLSLIILGKNVLSVIGPSYGDRKAQLNMRWTAMQAAAMLAVTCVYFTLWSLLSTLGTGWHVLAQLFYPLGMLVAMATIIRIGAYLRQRSGMRTDLESRLIELGVLVAVFIPTQFFGPRPGMPGFLKMPEFYTFSVNSIIFFIIIVGGLQLFRSAAPRRRAVLQLSPVLVGIALAMVIGVNFLSSPNIGPANGVIVLGKRTLHQTKVLYWNGNLKTDANGRATIVLPQGKEKVDMTLEAISTSGRKGVLLKQLNLPD